MISGHDTLMLQSLQKQALDNEAQLSQIEAAKSKLEADAAKANEDLEAKRRQYQEELADIKAKDLATLQANAASAVANAAAAQLRVEQAKDAFNKEVQALKALSMSKKDALKAELLTNADNIIDTVPWESQWVIPILQESRDRLQKTLDETMVENDGLIAWVVPRPVDEKAIQQIIERDLQALAEEKAQQVKG